MPFTPSHIAAVLPFRRATRLPLDALAVGAMSPDFEYLIRLAPEGGYGHTLRGVFTLCLPLSLLVVLAHRTAVRPAAIHLLPEGTRPAATSLPGLCPRDLILAAGAIVLGAFTHLVWDGFTHEQGVFVLALPWLQQEAIPGIARYRVGQHLSTLLGGAVLASAAWRWWRSHPAEARRLGPERRRTLLRAAAMVAAFTVLGTLGNAVRGIQAGAVRVIAYAAVGSLVGCAAGLLAAGVRFRPRGP